MIEFAHFIHVAFLPSITLCIALGVLWRYVELGRLRTAMQWLAAAVSGRAGAQRRAHHRRPADRYSHSRVRDMR